MAVRAVNTCSFFRSPPPPLSSALRSSRFAALHFSSRHRHRNCRCLRSPAFRSQPPIFSDYGGGGGQSRSFQSLFDSVMEELQAMRKRRKRVSAASNLGLLNEELLDDRLVNRSLQKGLLLEYKKDSDRILLAVAQRPDGKKNWMVSDQNGVTSSIKPQQITYIVPGIDNFDQADIADFVQKAQDNMDSSLLEFAWVELLEKNKSVTVEELAEIIFGSAEPLESYSAHLLLSKDEVYFTVLETKGSCSIYGPRPSEQVDVLLSGLK